MQLPVSQHFSTGPRSISAVQVLRISVTDRCNYRCLYCMPEEGVPWLEKQSILTFEEICQVIRAAIEHHNIRRFKLTGGEPTVRRDIVKLVEMIRAIDGVEDLSLTTNGQLLSSLARPLKEAGLDRITVSIDSLNPEKFKRITRTGDLSAVMHGLEESERVGFRSLKINCVTMRGTNDDEIPDFARLTLSRDVSVRFIEYMPLGDAALLHESEQGPAGGCGAQNRGTNALVPEPEVRELIERHLGPLIPVNRDSESGVGPAKIFKLQNAVGRIGFISAMSEPFCSTCNRLRLTADGLLRSCLFEGGEVDVRKILRTTSDEKSRRESLSQAMIDCVRLKPEVHSYHGNQQMSRIGG